MFVLPKSLKDGITQGMLAESADEIVTLLRSHDVLDLERSI